MCVRLPAAPQRALPPWGVRRRRATAAWRAVSARWERPAEAVGRGPRRRAHPVSGLRSGRGGPTERLAPEARRRWWPAAVGRDHRRMPPGWSASVAQAPAGRAAAARAPRVSRWGSEPVRRAPAALRSVWEPAPRAWRSESARAPRASQWVSAPAPRAWRWGSAQARWVWRSVWAPARQAGRRVWARAGPAWAPRSASAAAAAGRQGAGRGAAARPGGRPEVAGALPRAARVREREPPAVEPGARWAAPAAGRAQERGSGGQDAEQARGPGRDAAAVAEGPCSGQRTGPGSGRHQTYPVRNRTCSANPQTNTTNRRSLSRTCPCRRLKLRVRRRRASCTSCRRRQSRSPGRTTYRTSSVSAGTRNVRRSLMSIWRRFIAGVAILVLQLMAVCVSANTCSRGRVDSRGRGY